MSTMTAGPSMASPASTLNLLTNLPITHPSFTSLLASYTPFSATSSLPSSSLNKLLARINSAILAKDNENERRVAWEIAEQVLLQDVEGYAMQQFGKGWVTASLAALTVSSTPLAMIIPPLNLLSTLIVGSASYPSFERETIHPITGKVAVTLSRLLERSVSEGPSDWESTLQLAEKVTVVLEHAPAPFRPLAVNIKQSLRIFILSLPAPLTDPHSLPIIMDAPDQIKTAASNLIAALPNSAGKAQSPSAWGTAIREALGGIAVAMSAIVQDGWEEEPIKVNPPQAPSGLPVLPEEPNLRLQASLNWLEGFTQEVLALLRYPTSRPVPVPIAQIVAAGLRCLNLTLDTPTVTYITPQHQAALFASLPRVWSCGLLLIGGMASACEDHLFPHLSTILDHTTWLTERTPISMTQTHLQLLGFHHLFFELYPPTLVPVDYPSRLLRFSLAQYASILDARPGVVAVSAESGGKRGKKRARGAEDGLIGGLEGREAKAISVDTAELAIASLKLAAALHPTASLSPSLLTFSIRLHLSLHLHLASAPKTAFKRASDKGRLQDAVSFVLEQALFVTEGEQGTLKGWKTAILAVLESKSQMALPILHPSLPPLQRPQPPLAALHFFTKETEEERKLRRELGYSILGEGPDGKAGKDDSGDDADEVMEIEEERVVTVTRIEQSIPRSPLPVFTPTSASTPAVSVPPTIVPISAQPPVAPIPTPAPSVIAAVAPVEETMDAAPAAAEPFIASAADKGKSKEAVYAQPVQIKETFVSTAVDDDEPLPELDSGSSDEGEDGEEEDEEEEEVEE